MLRILKVFPGDEKFLRTKSAPVLLEQLPTADGSEMYVLPQEVTDLCVDMLETMQAHRAAGLSAVQVGEHRRIITFVREDGDTQVLINPEITELTGGNLNSTEGCLSFPSVFETITKTRMAEILVRGIDETGEMRTLALDGVQAVAVQHEVDHLNGVLFVDHMSPIKVRYALKRIAKVNKRVDIAKANMEKAISSQPRRRQQAKHFTE